MLKEEYDKALNNLNPNEMNKLLKKLNVLNEKMINELKPKFNDIINNCNEILKDSKDELLYNKYNNLRKKYHLDEKDVNIYDIDKEKTSNEIIKLFKRKNESLNKKLILKIETLKYI